MHLIHKIQTLYIHYLSRLVLFSVRHAVLVIAASVILALACLTYSRFYLPISSEQERLVSHESPFLKRERTFSDAFPQHNNTIIILLEGKDSWSVGQKAAILTKKLQARPDFFTSVFYPQGMSFFHQNGLLYLKQDTIADFADGLAQAQPAIASLSKDPSLRGLWQLLDDGFTAPKENSPPESFTDIIKNLNLALENFLTNRKAHNIWQEAFPNWSTDGKTHENVLQVIVVKPILDFSSILSGQKAIENVREIAKSVALDEAGVSMMLTGREPLTFDEFVSIVFNIEVAAAISTLAIIVLLGFGVRSWRLIGIIMGVLFTGMSWTLGWAALSVGELNLVSAAFAVLFMGICVDFSIHVALRYREEYRKCHNIEEAMIKTTEGAGGAISLCALATAIGFLSFAPTEYYGLRDLGIIAGGSIFLALLGSWTLLPALLKFLPAKDLERALNVKPNMISRFSIWLYEWVQLNFRLISIAALVLGIAVFPYALKMRFEYSALAIKDPNSESVIALDRLFDYGLFTDYTATILAKDRKDAEAIAKQFEGMPLVRRVDSHLAFVPKNQESKLELIEEAQFLLGPALTPAPKKPVSEQALTRATKNLLRTLAKKNRGAGLSAAERKLSQNLTVLLKNKPDQLLRLNQELMGDYDERIQRLAQSLQAESFTFDDLPKQVRQETETKDGRIKVSIYPKENLTDSAALARFVKTLGTKSDAIGGRPAAEHAVGALMVRSFEQALVISVIVIGLLLLLSLRSFTKTLFVLAPIVLTAIWTLAFCVLFAIHFNFVNVLMLPLLLGLGVANGIHILSRAQQYNSIREVMRSSTPVAVFLSNATTLASFGSMSVATHWGLQSMGITLTIAMVLMMFSALVILPAILAWAQNQSLPRSPK